jgi:hypothetical protein
MDAPPLLDLYQAPHCQRALAHERTLAWHNLTRLEPHASCNQAHVIPSLRAIYVENQKAASRSMLMILNKLANGTVDEVMTAYVGSDCASLLEPGPYAQQVLSADAYPGSLACFLSGFAELVGRVDRGGQATRSRGDFRFDGDSPPSYYDVGTRQSEAGCCANNADRHAGSIDRTYRRLLTTCRRAGR